MQNRGKTIKYAFKASLPILAGYLLLGMGFGVLLQSKGYAWWWAAFMSVSMFSGSMQYMGVDLLAGGASLITAALVTLTVNIRHIFYGITMLDRYSKAGKFKPYIIFSMTDETFSLVCSPDLPDEVDQNGYYFFLSAFNHCYWISGCVLGAVIGQTFAFNSQGIEFVMTALFTVIFTEQWEKTRNHLPALTGVAVSVICLLLFGGDFLIPAMVCITLALFAEKRWMGGLTDE